MRSDQDGLKKVETNERFSIKWSRRENAEKKVMWRVVTREEESEDKEKVREMKEDKPT